MGYWPDHLIEGSLLDLSHLEPFHLDCHVQNLDRTLRIDVKFSNHCFTEQFDDSAHDPALKIMDASRPRAFNRRRYELSSHLPGLVRSLPQSAVWQTPVERNFMYFMTLTDASGHDYQMFFHLKKARSQVDLSLMVESAYPVESARDHARICSKVRFPVLCAAVFQSRKLRFHVKR
jgi:hypothetical protein